MLPATPYRSYVSGTGHYLPERRLTNADLEKIVDTNDAWIVERTGISARHIAADHEATSDLCLQAALKALSDAHLTANDIDLILVASVSGDQVMPSTACHLQAKLGARKVMAFDLIAACSGFVYGLMVADQFIRSGMYKHILVVGAEVLHRYIDYSDRQTCILFGDGAGAWVVSRAEPGQTNLIGSSFASADGTLGDLLELPAGGSRLPFSQSVLDNRQQYVIMKGREIFKNAVRAMSLCCEEVLKSENVAAEQINWLIPHQANLRIIEATAKDFGISMDKVILSLHETGNTSAASIPIAFGFGIAEGKIKRGDQILLTAFGAGLTCGAIYLRF